MVAHASSSLRRVVEPPRPIDRLHGRQALLERARAVLAAHRALTLVGVVGAGKTRLALELAAGRRACLVDLSAARDEAGLCRAFAEATGLPTRARASELDLQAEGECLWILDAVDALAPVVAEALQRWLARAPAASFVLTLRRFHPCLPQVVPVGALPIRDALDLLIERTRRHRPGFARAVVERRHARVICARLDGIPQALELAAGWLAIMEADRVCEWLEGSADLLDEGGTLRRGLLSSWRDLSDTERAVLQLLSAFEGPAPLAALEPCEPAELRALKRLVQQGLATPVEHGRWGICYRIGRLVRQFVWSRGRCERALRRHGQWVMRAVVELPEAERPLLEAEVRSVAGQPCHEGYHAPALACQLLARVALRRGESDGAERWMAQGLRGAAGAPTAAVRLLLAWARLRWERKDPEAEALLVEAERQAGLLALVGASAADRLRVVARAALIGCAEGGSTEALERLADGLAQVEDPEGAWVRDLIARRFLAMGRASKALELALDPGLSVLAEADLRGQRKVSASVHRLLAGSEPPCAHALALKALLLPAPKIWAQAQAAAEERDLKAWCLSNRLLAALVGSDSEEQAATRPPEDALAADQRLRELSALGPVEDPRLAVWIGALEQAAGCPPSAPPRRPPVACETTRWVRAVGSVLERLQARGEAFDPHLPREAGDLLMQTPLLRGALWDLSGLKALVTARIARYLTSHAVETTRPGDPEPRPQLWVGESGGWFIVDAGDRVDLSRRKALRLVLRELLSARLGRPGEPLSVESLVAAGWPGEQLVAQSGRARLYVTISELRKLGLEPCLRRDDEGYSLDTGWRVYRVAEQLSGRGAGHGAAPMGA